MQNIIAYINLKPYREELAKGSDCERSYHCSLNVIDLKSLVHIP